MHWWDRLEVYALRLAQWAWYLVTFQTHRIPARSIQRRLADRFCVAAKDLKSLTWSDNDTQPLALIIDSFYPTPDRDSGSIDALNLISALQTVGYRVVFLATSYRDGPAREAIEKQGVFCPEALGQEERFFAQIEPLLAVVVLSRVWSGGAFLEWMEGKTLPGVEVLRIQ